MSTPAWQRFAGKVALVTGAASGIGAATAQRLAAEGAALALCDLREQPLREFAGRLALAPERLFFAAVDVADGAALGNFVDAAAAHFGRLDVLVNNAGQGAFGHVDELTPETWHRIMSVNVDSVFFASRTAIPHLRRSGGNIVNLGSISGMFADPGLAAYTASKAAVINLTSGMALDHAGEGLRVNCVCPGAIGTPMLKPHMRDEGIMAEYARLIPMGRVASAEEVASAICFLASAEASYITGVALVIDGGVTAASGQPNFDRLYRERGWVRNAQGEKT